MQRVRKRWATGAQRSRGGGQASGFAIGSGARQYMRSGLDQLAHNIYVPHNGGDGLSPKSFPRWSTAIWLCTLCVCSAIVRDLLRPALVSADQLHNCAISIIDLSQGACTMLATSV